MTACLPKALTADCGFMSRRPYILGGRAPSVAVMCTVAKVLGRSPLLRMDLSHRQMLTVHRRVREPIN